MKIGFLTTEYPSEKTGFSGGIGTSIKNLAKGINELGYEVYIFVYGQKEDEFYRDEEINIIRIKKVMFKGFSRFLTQKKIQKIVNQYNLDIVEAPEWTGFTSNISLNCPLVIKLHGSDTYFCHLDNRPVRFINKYYEKKALLKANAYISVSQYTANLTNQLFNSNYKFKVIPNSIDTLKFSNEQLSNVQENTILYFGTLIRKKGLLELPLIFNEVYKKNPNAKLILIGRDASDVISGNTSTWKMMQSLFNENAIKNVNYLGSVSYDEIKNHICNATVCVFPTFAEALPVSWIEAMALKKAIVASNIGWANEVIDDNVNGYLVNPKNHLEYAQKIYEMLNNFGLRNKFGIEARIKVEQSFSIENVAMKSVEFYNEIIKNANKS